MSFPQQSVSLPQIWMGLTRVIHPFTSTQWSCHLTIVLGDKSIPNDSNYQIRKAIMTKIGARGPGIPGGWLLPATCNCYFSIPIINHVTGGSKYWNGGTRHQHFLQIVATKAENSLSSILLITLRHHLPLSERLFLALWWYKPHHKVKLLEGDLQTRWRVSLEM